MGSEGAYGTQASLFDDKFLSDSARKKHRLIGQVFGTYWLIEYENNLKYNDEQKNAIKTALNNTVPKDFFSFFCPIN